jgi:hypothetical protein
MSSFVVSDTTILGYTTTSSSNIEIKVRQTIERMRIAI